MRKKSIIIISNTSFGTPGNIGFRLNHIIENTNDFNFKVFARYYKKNNLNTNLYLFISRFFSFLRQKVFTNKNIRFFDEYLFERLFFLFVTFRWFLNPNRLPELAHISGYYPSLMLFLKKRGIPIVLDVAILPNSCLIELGNQYSDKYLKNPELRLEKRERECFDLAEKILCPSKFVHQKMSAVYPEYQEKMVVIPFGVNSGKYGQIKRDISSKNILFAGALNERKGVELLVKSFLDINPIDSKLYLCGRGFKSTKISNDVRIIKLGFVDLDPYLSKCSIFVLPTFMEGSAKVIYEAMAAGLAVVTTPAAGSIIKDGFDGIIVASGDQVALTSSIQRLLVNEKLRRSLGDRAVNSIQYYSWERYVETVNTTYRSIVKCD